MLIPPGYQKVSLIYESTKSIVYRCVRQTDQTPVIHKVLRVDYPTDEEQNRYKQEYEILRSLNLEGVIKVYDFIKYNNNFVLVLEDFGGKSLKRVLVQTEFCLIEKLALFIKIVESLTQIHQNYLIHKDINPANIVFNLNTKVLKLIDFGISTRLRRENPTLKNPDVLEGTLIYMSPEQTGRMNRCLDYRTDFYSLGVTFYELLTNQLPFLSQDMMELVHCHIAKQPIPPSQLNPEIPQAVSDIVMKLLAKNAEDRYQSALGIKADLEFCLNQLQNQGKIIDFVVGRQDVSDQFQIPQKLYGREQYIDSLLTTFEQVNQGQTQMLLVSGYSGIGKSSLVQEIYKPLTQKRAYFISGKFDQLQRNIPYSAIVAAFQSLIEQLLTESETQLNDWKEKLLSALGLNGKVMTDVIPELELIIGSQPDIQDLAPTEAQNRFNLVFQNFLRVFCQGSHPLVIFLDDLQWADSATLNLIQLMMTDLESKYLFLLGAYRDNEVNLTHPLIATLEELKKVGVLVKEITLAPLELEHIIQLIADTLKRKPEEVKSLATLIQGKTLGNPFFINEFLKYLYQENLIIFQANERNWKWNINQIKSINITDNVVDLMIKKVKKLPQSTQEILCNCACIGNIFDLKILSTITNQESTSLFQELLPAIQFGLIVPTSELEAMDIQDVNSPLLIFNYKFLHDRVQQAAYALIDEENKKAVHLKIGRLLLSKLSEEEKDEKLFSLVDHLNLGSELIINQQEKRDLARLNLEAGQKAKKAIAFLAAKEYLTNSLNLIQEEIWNQDYNLALTLHQELAEIEIIIGNIHQSELLIHILLKQVKSDLEKAEAYLLLIMQYSLSGQPEKAIEAGRQALAILGVDLPEFDLQLKLDIEWAKAKQNLGSQSIASLINQPEIQDRRKKIIANLLVMIDPAAYFINQELYAIIVLKSVNLYLKSGDVAAASKGYSTYGILLGSLAGDYQSGYEFGLLALQVSEKYHSLAYQSQACFILANFLTAWVKPISETEIINNQGFSAGMESGEIPYAGYILVFQSINAFYQGLELSQLLAKLLTALDFFKKYKNQWSQDAGLGLELAIFNLLGMTDDQLDFDNNEITEQNYLDSCEAHKSLAWICYYYILKTQILYLYGKPEEALTFSKKAEEFISCMMGMIPTAEHNFYTSLSLIALYRTKPPEEQRNYDKILNVNQRKLKRWAENCPENFFHRYCLVEAEIARIKGQVLAAIDWYNQAIASARQNNFIQNEALANELTAHFWLEQGKEQYAKIHLREAYYAYQRWGAKYKLEDLEKQYPQFLFRNSDHLVQDTTIPTHNSSTGSRSSSLDVLTVLKASQAIASEIVLDKLLASLIQISIENAGAQKGVLLLAQEGELFIEASASVDSEVVLVRQSIPLQVYHGLPSTVINYVKRTRSDLVLKDAMFDERFGYDAYISSYHIKSILCTPILSQGKLVAILYLEHNLASGVFTSERLEILKLLCTQAAISLENAILYSTLENKVQERTEELNQKNIRLQEALTELKRTQTQLIQTEKMSSLGQLVAGVAHEINNPVNFIYGNLIHIDEYTQNLLNLVQLYSNYYPKPVEEIQQELEEIELEFLAEDLPKLLSSMKVGSERIRQIVLSLRSFSRLDEADMKAVDIHEGLENTLLILQNRIKASPDHGGIEVIKDYGKLPEVECYAGQLNQVFMNILVNACDALEDKMNEQDAQLEPPMIRIHTALLNPDWVTISIADNGLGMTEEVKTRLFDPFFTTKSIGKGTGLGMAISYQIVVEKHKGQLWCNSELGKGTEFMIEIPIRPEIGNI